LRVERIADLRGTAMTVIAERVRGCVDASRIIGGRGIRRALVHGAVVVVIAERVRRRENAARQRIRSRIKRIASVIRAVLVIIADRVLELIFATSVIANRLLACFARGIVAVITVLAGRSWTFFWGAIHR